MPAPTPLLVDLVEPSSAERACSERVMQRVVDACAAEGGSIGFDRFMDIALYAPGCGYYNAPRTRIGPGGDFVTAPEISPRFAAALARAVAPALAALGGSLVEAGAGRGTLARDLLTALARLGARPERYLILERSASARAEQAEVLGPLAERVSWLDDFPGHGFRGVVLANELLDAIPAHRFRIRGGAPRELRVAGEAGALRYLEAPFRDSRVETRLARALQALAPLPEGYESEFGPARGAWLASLAERIDAGLVLIADYGYPRGEYYHPQRHRGTLACHHRHRLHDDPFRFPGLQDLSVHVEFTDLAEAAARAGLALRGFTTQAHFLLENGLVEGLDDPSMDDRARIEAAHAVGRLTLPAQMGEAVKFIAFSRGLDAPVRGFGHRDMSHRL